jgi:surface antigen
MKKLIMSGLVFVMCLASFNAEAKNGKAGAVVGAVVGAVIGNDLADGGALGTVIGAIAGAAIGSEIGDAMDDRSRSEMSYAQARALERSRSEQWRGSNYYGNFIVIDSGYYNSYECRSYRNEIYSYSGRLVEVRSGTTCYGSRGWYEERSSVVVWR